jgi:hypothetical protein
MLKTLEDAMGGFAREYATQTDSKAREAVCQKVQKYLDDNASNKQKYQEATAVFLRQIHELAKQGNKKA